MSDVSIFAPAKLNLFLAITGRRTDGFHELVSVVAPLDFGDTLRAQRATEFSLECDQPDVPADDTNLVLVAARAFRRQANGTGCAKFFLGKRIPMGAGLGGGSSDAIAALRALNEFAGQPLGTAGLAQLAAEIGSDCPLFLHDGPVVMRGRGERIEPLPATAAARLRGGRVLVFKPAFDIATAWSYAQLAATAGSYLPVGEAEARLEAWLESGDATAEDLLWNNMEAPAFAKFPALPLLLEQLRSDFGVQPRMSGSGSACFVLLRQESPVAALTSAIRAAWGESAFVVEARLT